MKPIRFSSAPLFTDAERTRICNDAVAQVERALANAKKYNWRKVDGKWVRD